MKRTSLKMPNTSTPNALCGLPLTATRPALLPGKSDRAFRKLLSDFFTVADRIETTRRHVGAVIGISGPQFSMMMAIAELEGSTGVSVGQVADYMHVAPPFVTAESGKLCRKGYLEKKVDTVDRRVSRLRIGRNGREALESLIPLVQQINDVFFDLESREQFKTLCRALDQMVGSSRRALALAVAAAPDGLRVAQ